MKYSDCTKIRKLSNNVKTAVEHLEWCEELAELDDIYAAERCDLKSDLNAVMLNRMPWFLEKKEFPKNLSLVTTLEGQLLENPVVQKVVAKVNLEWIKARSICLMGNANFKRYVYKPPKRVVKTNNSVELCNKYFENELKIFLKNYCKSQGNANSVEFLMMDPCDVIVKNRLNNLKKKLAEHFEFTIRDLRHQSPETQHLAHLSASKNNPKQYATDISTPKLPKISDFTNGLIQKVICKKSFSAYDHLNAQYSNRIENSIKDMSIEEELETIIQKELVDLNRSGEDKCKRARWEDEIGKDLKVSRYRKVMGDPRVYRDEFEDILNAQLEDLIDQKLNQLSTPASPNRLESQFEVFNKELNMGEGDNNYRNDKYNRVLRENTKESSKKKSLPATYYEEEDDGGKRMRAVYDETISNDDEVYQRKSSNNLHIVLADDYKEGMHVGGGDEGPDVRSRGKSARDYYEKKSKKMLYGNYYLEDGTRVDELDEMKKRRKRGVNEERKKKKKDDKKHKKKKRNKHKEREEVVEKEDKVVEKVSVFQPDSRLYSDSVLSFCIDVFQFKHLSGDESATEVVRQAPTTRLDMNFCADFDITQAPSLIHDTPLMRMFLDTSNAMHAAAETIFHLKDFNIDVVDCRNAFLWCLVLTSLDNLQSNKALASDLDGPGTPQLTSPITPHSNSKKSNSKSSSNPLIQAFKQAVEANKNKQKEDKSAPSSSLKPSKYLLMGNMGSGLSTLFRLQSNLKAGTRDMVKEITEAFQKDLQKFLRKQNFLDSRDAISSPIKCDFSDSLHHFQSISNISHKLYTEAEFKLSQREKLLKYKQQYNKYGTYSLAGAADDAFSLTFPTATSTTTTTTSEYTTSTSTMITYYNASQHSAPTSSQASQASKSRSVTTTTEAPATTNNPQNNYNYYSGYHPYNWSYMPQYNMPAYPPNYFHPFYSHYPPMAQHYPPYNFLANRPPPSLPTTTTTTTSVFSDSSHSKHSRFYVFMIESQETIAVEKHLENSGLKRFDIHNISLLNYIGNFECQIFIHHPLLPSIHHLPNLLTLKRDPRVIFGEFSSIDDVREQMFKVVFPRGGVVLLDLSVLLACKSDVLESFCKHLSSTSSTEAPWTLITSCHASSAIQALSCQLMDTKPEEHERLTELNKILSTHQSQGLLQLMNNQSQPSIPQLSDQSKPSVSDQPESSIIQSPNHDQLTEDASNKQEVSATSHSTDQPTDQPANQSSDLPTLESTNDYYNYLLNFQTTNLHTYRHFVFITDLPRTHPDTQLFLSCGMEVFSVVDFMQAFASKTVLHDDKRFDGFATRVTSQTFTDAPLSLCSQTISFSNTND